MSEPPHRSAGRLLRRLAEGLRARLPALAGSPPQDGDDGESAPRRLRPWWLLAIAVPLALVLVLTVALTPGDEPADRFPAGATGAPRATDSPAPGPACASTGQLQVHAPAPGAQLRPGHVLVAGTSTAAERSMRWILTRARNGAQVASGFVQPEDLGAGGAWTVILDLSAGDYAVTVSLLGDGSVADPCATTESTFTLADSVTGPTWASGASGDQIPTGEFAEWRGTEMPIAGAWADSNQGQIALWQLQPRGQYGRWTDDLDYAIGAIERHESWAAAARGAYDARWTRSLQELDRLWDGRPGTLYLRFAHEFNGTWFPWSVTAGESAEFIAAWQRFRALQLTHFPEAKLVFTPNYETPAGLQFDWRTFFPGAEHVDVISIPYFNAWPYIGTTEEFWHRALAVDAFGAPSGIHRHAEFARSVGLPFAISEWGPHAAFGDAGVYMEEMNQYFRIMGGTGPGDLLYEILFNVPIDSNAFALMPTTRAPEAAERYRELW